MLGTGDVRVIGAQELAQRLGPQRRPDEVHEPDHRPGPRATASGGLWNATGAVAGVAEAAAAKAAGRPRPPPGDRGAPAAGTEDLPRTVVLSRVALTVPPPATAAAPIEHVPGAVDHVALGE